MLGCSQRGAALVYPGAQREHRQDRPHDPNDRDLAAVDIDRRAQRLPRGKREQGVQSHRHYEPIHVNLLKLWWTGKDSNLRSASFEGSATLTAFALRPRAPLARPPALA